MPAGPFRAGEAMRRLHAQVDAAARSDVPVLILGESGTGKESVARAIHAGGPRRQKPFVAVRLGAIPAGLLRSELLDGDYDPGTAESRRQGQFARADGGTFYLLRIERLAPDFQTLLFSAMEQEAVPASLGRSPIPADVRIIASSDGGPRPFSEECAFSVDLFERAGGTLVEMPPLREHKEDIPELALHFVRQFAEQLERRVPECSPDLMRALVQSDWPGNITELRDYLERLVALTPEGVLQPNPPPRDLDSRA